MKRSFKYLSAVLLPLTMAKICAAQTSEWGQSSQWTIYNTRGEKFYRIPLDSLTKFKSRALNDDSVHIFLSNLSILPSDKPPVWMGAYIATCILRGKKRKIDISTYGAFLFDEANKKFYIVPPEVQKDWLNYLADCAGALSTKE